MPDSKLLEDAVLARAGWISNVLIGGVLLSATMSLIRVARKTEFEVLKIGLPVRLFPLACVAYTSAHVYCTILFVQTCRLAAKSPSIWYALTLKGPLVFAGMLPRTQKRLPWLGFSVDYIDAKDPTLWLFYVFCLTVYMGFVWACEIGGFSLRTRKSLAFGLLLVNWITGGIWAHVAQSLR